MASSDGLTVSLSIDCCPQHRDFWAVCINVGNSGTRITPSKCCGHWREVRKWSLSERDLRNAAEEFIAAADALAREARPRTEETSLTRNAAVAGNEAQHEPSTRVTSSSS